MKVIFYCFCSLWIYVLFIGSISHKAPGFSDNPRSQVSTLDTSNLSTEFVKAQSLKAKKSHIEKSQGPGPSAPEVQKFTPFDATELVDPFTGDFSYSIPLMDVEGYPITITYNSGVKPEDEASFVG